MLRKIIRIDEEKCTGCGLCADACHEGAIGIVNNKAKLLREDFCDGLGDCLPACPENAITFEEREAPAYNEAAVKAAKMNKQPCGCPGMQAKKLERSPAAEPAGPVPGQLSNWPVQIKLVPVQAPYFADADLLGVPVRVIVSPRNLKENKVEIVTRDKTVKALVATEDAEEYIAELLKQLSEKL